MKTLFLFPALVALFTTAAFAEAPEPLTDFHKTLSAASKDQKLAFILLGRPTCGNCNATKAMIKQGKIAVTSSDYVMGDLNVDDQRTEGEFMRRYGKEKFGNTLPFVVVTDSHGKLLASSGGYQDANKWNALLAEAKGKLTAKAAAGAGGAEANWPFKTAPKPQ
jgi:thioredoxin-related protein